MFNRNDIAKILYDESVKYSLQIKKNIRANGQSVTGKTESSVRPESDDSYLRIYAAEHIDTLEKGISPEFSKRKSFGAVMAGLQSWITARGFSGSGFSLGKWSYSAAKKQQTIGSIMYRNKTTKNVYSAEIEPTLESLKNRVGYEIVNTKILE